MIITNNHFDNTNHFDREWAWDIFKTVTSKCKTDSGFATYPNVLKKNTEKLTDEVQSYFPAATLKYFYLIINPKPMVDLKQKVITTGGHILPVHNH